MRNKGLAAVSAAAYLLITAVSGACSEKGGARECVWALKEIRLGRTGGFTFRAVERVRAEAGANPTCAREGEAGATKEIALLAFAHGKEARSWSLLELPYGLSGGDASLAGARRRGNRFHVRLALDGQDLDSGTEDTSVFEWDSAHGVFRSLGGSSTSPSAREREKLWAQVRAADFPAARKSLAGLDYLPNGRSVIASAVAQRLAEEAWPRMMAAFRSGDQARVAQWLDFFGGDFPTQASCPFGIPEQCSAEELFGGEFPRHQKWAAILSDFAYLLSQHGRREQAEALLRRILALDPSRTVAHLSLAGLLRGRGAEAEAAFHYRIYRRRMEAQGLDGRISAPAPMRGQAGPGPAPLGAGRARSEFSPRREAAAAGARRELFEGRAWAGFASLRFTPPSYFLKLRRRPGLPGEFFLVKREFALGGFPLREGSRFAVDSAFRLASGIAGARFESQGLPFRAGEQIVAQEGAIIRGTLDRDVDSQGFRLQGGTVVALEGGRLSAFRLRENQRIGRFVAAKGKYLKLFTGSGGYPGLTLAEPAEFRGLRLPAGTRLLFDLSGHRRRIFPEERNAQVESPAEVVFPDGGKFRSFVLGPKGERLAGAVPGSAPARERRGPWLE